MNELNYPLTNAQIEILKLFGTNLTDKEMDELKNLLSGYYAAKATEAADKIWNEKGLSSETMDKWLNEET